MSCMVQTTGLRLFRIFSIDDSDRNPWFIQCRWMMSASWNSGSRVMSKPVLAVDTLNRFLRWNRLHIHICSRSYRKYHSAAMWWFMPMTVSESVSLSRTNILAFTPLFIRAFIRRLAATAAPPVCSLVFTISTFIFLFSRHKGTTSFVKTK